MNFNHSALPREIHYKGVSIKPLHIDFSKMLAKSNLDFSHNQTRKGFRQFLVECFLSGASDITFQSNCSPRIKIGGCYCRVDLKIWNPMFIQFILEELYGANNALAETKSRKILDFAYDLIINSKSRIRFRVNATGIRTWDGVGVEVSLRVLPNFIPTLDDVGLIQTELMEWLPESGIIIIAGATGSGKTSTLASILHLQWRCLDKPKKIITIESPIEYVFLFPKSHTKEIPSTISQSEVGINIPSFASGVRSALRRNPDIIVIGEMRDQETIQAALEAAYSGHLVLTTTHSTSIVDTIRRLMINEDGNGFTKKAYDLISVLRTIMFQELIQVTPKVPKLIPRREILHFTQSMRERLLSLPPDRWMKEILSYSK